MRLALLALASLTLSACASDGLFRPQSAYPPDPYVKGYADPQDCLGGEQLAALSLELPDYPKRAYRTGRQGWVLVRLDVGVDGRVTRAEAEREVPDGPFGKAAETAVRAWRFEPPRGGPLSDCRVLIRFRLGEVSLGG